MTLPANGNHLALRTVFVVKLLARRAVQHDDLRSCKVQRRLAQDRLAVDWLGDVAEII